MAPVRLLLAALGAALVLLAVPVAAQAGCGHTVYAKPKTWVQHRRPPLFIGDSTGIFATPRLAAQGVEANSRGCRQMSEGLALMRRRKAAHGLPRVVIIHLGANWTVTQGDISQALRIDGPHRILVLVTSPEEGGGSGADATNERVMAKRHPQRIRLLDWVRYSRGHPSWFYSDGLHVTPQGADALTHFIAPAAKRFNTPWGQSVPRR